MHWLCAKQLNTVENERKDKDKEEQYGKTMSFSALVVEEELRTEEPTKQPAPPKTRDQWLSKVKKSSYLENRGKQTNIRRKKWLRK